MLEVVVVEEASTEEVWIGDFDDADDANDADDTDDAGAIKPEAGLDGATNVCDARFSVGRAVEVRSVHIS